LADNRNSLNRHNSGPRRYEPSESSNSRQRLSSAGRPEFGREKDIDGCLNCGGERNTDD
jgi:hypothetical protein